MGLLWLPMLTMASISKYSSHDVKHAELALNLHSKVPVLVMCTMFSSPFLYFSTVMCSERIEKITKTYHDIDAVTTLLEEVSFTNCSFRILSENIVQHGRGLPSSLWFWAFLTLILVAVNYGMSRKKSTRRVLI